MSVITDCEIKCVLRLSNTNIIKMIVWHTIYKLYIFCGTSGVAFHERSTHMRKHKNHKIKKAQFIVVCFYSICS